MLFKKKQKDNPKISAIIAAGGSSSRMDGIDKQLLPLDDVPVLVHTLSMFEQCPLISEIILVCREDAIGDYMRLTQDYAITKTASIVCGGDTRQKSVFCGIKAASKDTAYYLIHDGARPLVSEEVIEDCIKDAIIHKAATAAVKSKDTIKIADKDGFISGTPNRAYTYLTQTPQVFAKPLYDRAMAAAIADGRDYTDDCQLIEGIQHKVFLSKGDYQNIKITTPEDIVIAEALLAIRRYEN